jgi:Protein of unknown function (DUF3224)
MPTHKATGWINVTSYDPQSADRTDGVAHVDIRVREDFTGGLVGRGRARLVMVQMPDGSAHFTGIEHFTGALDGRPGSFLLRNSGVFRGGTVTSEWLILPGSATGALAGLEGTGSTGPEGYVLDYSFLSQ